MIDDLTMQARYCEATSPLYAALFAHLADLFEARSAGQPAPELVGFFATIDACWRDRNFTAWFERPLLLAGAIHEQALLGEAPTIAPYYASCGGQYDLAQRKTLGQAVTKTLCARHQAMIPFLSQNTIQTNESSRGMTWLLPLLTRWRQQRPAATLIELGCSAGLGLVADHYGYRITGPAEREWTKEGAPLFEIALEGRGADKALSSLAGLDDLSAAIQSRIGCDLNPLDCRDENQKRVLEALIWPDNAPRLARLHAAIHTQQHSGIQFKAGDMVACVRQLAETAFTDTPMICLFNTVATCYLNDEHYRRLRKAIAAAFHDQWASKDCLWIEFEIPRSDECLPDFALGAEQLIKTHVRDGQGGLTTDYFGAAAAHPKVINIY